MYPSSGRQKSTTVSAGRKELSRNVEIPDGYQCEWAGLAKAGGGVVTIVGCRPEEERLAECKHHGPDKSTLNNEPNNFHLLCTRCHNRWHQLNNNYYGIRPEDNGTYLPKNGILILHDPVTKATEEDYVRTENYWKGKKLWKAKKE